MRAYEFINESATAGASCSGNVATVVKPLRNGDSGASFFGGDLDEYPKYGDTDIAVIRRIGPTAEAKNKKVHKKLAK